MDARTALDHLFLIAADGHISKEDGSYEHPWSGNDACDTCAAMVEIANLRAALESPASKDSGTAELEPLKFEVVGGGTMDIEWEIDQARFSITRVGEGTELWLSVALELPELVQLRDKMITPAIALEQERQRALVIERERERIAYEAKAEERAREEAERERAQSFRGVSVQRTITQNMTVHGRTCASLSSARARQTTGTVIFGLTPMDLIKKLPATMKGRLNLRFCAKCKPIPNTQQINSYLGGNAPLEWSMEELVVFIALDIWEGHHSALTRYDERSEH